MSPEAHALPPGAEKLGLRPEPEFEEETDNYRLAGYTNQDRTKGFLLLEKKQSDLELELEEVQAKIQAGGIVFGVDENAVKRCLARAAARSKIEIVEIARGREPEDGLDGKIEFYVQPSSEEARYAKDASGRVNYHELNLIENVAPEQELARLLPPKPGVAGSTVLGEVMASRNGEPARARAGKSVTVAENGEVFLAEVPGRLVYEDDSLEISQEFEVKGDVDYSVGNIDFLGKVTITGEILDDFNVKADMGLEVRGPVGNCRLESSGDIVLAGGISGKTKGSVKAGGDVRARYLNEVTVEAGGSVTVEREAYNSIIRTGGAYRSPGGKVLGGDITALKGIEVGTAGSDLGVATKLCAGIDYRSAGRRRRMAEELEATDKEIERISTAIGPLLADPTKVQALPIEKKKAVLNLVSHLKKLKEKREVLSGQRTSGAAPESQEAVKQINVKDTVFTGVTAEVSDCRLLLKKDATGPLTMVEDIAGGTVRLMPYRELGQAAEAPEGDPATGELPAPPPPQKE